MISQRFILSEYDAEAVRGVNGTLCQESLPSGCASLLPVELCRNLSLWDLVLWHPQLPSTNLEDLPWQCCFANSPSLPLLRCKGRRSGFVSRDCLRNTGAQPHSKIQGQGSHKDPKKRAPADFGILAVREEPNMA